MRNFITLLISLFLLFLITGCSVNNNYGIRVENDIIGDSDKNYTHGTFFTHSSSPEHSSSILKHLSKVLPSFRVFTSDPAEVVAIKSELGQEIHTPSDLTTKELIEEDNPYAGYLYGKLAKVYASENIKIETSLELGVIGPSSLADRTQWFVHHDLGRGTDPLGWDNQLSDEPVINMSHIRVRQWNFTPYLKPVTKVRSRVGMVHTDFRFSNGLESGYNIPNLNGTNLDEIALVIFGYSNLDFVARNIFYDGNTWEDSHRVSTEHIIGSVDYGILLGYKGYSLKFQVTTTSKQYEEQSDSISTYGGLIFGLDW